MSSISCSKSLACVPAINREHAAQAQASRAEATVDAQPVRQFAAGDEGAFPGRPMPRGTAGRQNVNTQED